MNRSPHRMRLAAATLAATFAAVAVTLVGVPSALAGVQSGSGTLYLAPPSALLFSKQIGQDTIAAESGTFAFTGGTIVGTGTVTVTALVTPTGESFVAYWTAPATVAGQRGTLAVYFDGTDNGVFSGHFLAVGSGALSGLVGHGAYSGEDSPGTGTYTLTYIG